MAKVCQSRLVAAGEVFSSLTRPQHWQLCDTVMTYSQSEVCVSWCYCEKAGIEAFLLFIYIFFFYLPQCVCTVGCQCHLAYLFEYVLRSFVKISWCFLDFHSEDLYGSWCISSNLGVFRGIVGL